MKLLLKILVAILIFTTLSILAIYALFKSAFGEQKNEFRFELENQKVLFGTERTSADFANVWYDVDFFLKTEGDTFFLGRTLFLDNPDWQRNIELIDNSNWYLIPLNKNEQLHLFGSHKYKLIKCDTLLLPENLRKDSLFNSKYSTNVPMWNKSGSSNLDSIVNNEMYISFIYKDGYYPPLNEYQISIATQLNQTGDLKTQKLFDRKLLRTISKSEEEK